MESSRTTDILDLVEYNAHVNPHHTFCFQLEVVTGNIQSQIINNEMLLRMTSNCQRWLTSSLPEPISTQFANAPVAMMIDSDVGLIVHMLAAIGLGIQVFLISNRQSPYRLRNLLAGNNISTLIISESCLSCVNETLTLFDCDLPVKVYPALHYQHLLRLPRGEVDTLKRCHPRSDSTLTLHTYSPTRLPRAVPIHQDYLINLAYSLEDSEMTEVETLFSTFPYHHCCGLLAPMLSLKRPDTVFISPPSSWIPCAEATLRILRLFSVHSLITMPCILERMAEIPGAVTLLCGFRRVAYTWDQLRFDVGDQLVKAGVKLVNVYGCTGVGIISTLDANCDWRSFRLRQDLLFDVQPYQLREMTTYKIKVVPPGYQTHKLLSGSFIKNIVGKMDFRVLETSDEHSVVTLGGFFGP